MKIFMTGGTGRLGTFLIPQLVAEGHSVVALSRSEAGAAKVASLGATPLRGADTDADIVSSAAANADAVIHMSFDFGLALQDAPKACANDRAAITAMCDALVGTGKTFMCTSGTVGTIGSDEADVKADNPHWPRGLSEAHTHSYSAKGVRTLVVRLPPVVHGRIEQHQFITDQIAAAKKLGFAAYIGDGTQVWPSVHYADAARAYVLALNKDGAPSGSNLHPVREEAIPLRDIAGKIAQKLGVETKSVRPEEAMGIFGFTGMVASMDNPTSSAKTRKWLGWEPKEGTLLEAMDEYYTF